MITITIKLHTDGKYMHVDCYTRRRSASAREIELSTLARAVVKEAMQKVMIAQKNGILLSGPNEKLNKQLIQRWKAKRK